MRSDHKEAYIKAVEVWGKEIQLVVLMEECAELIKATSKYLRNNCKSGAYGMVEHDLMKEVEDVRIMLNQLEYGVIKKPDYWKQYRKGVFDEFLSKLNKHILKDGGQKDEVL